MSELNLADILSEHGADAVLTETANYIMANVRFWATGTQVREDELHRMRGEYARKFAELLGVKELPA